MRSIKLVLCALLIFSLAGNSVFADESAPLIGDVEKTFQFAGEFKNIVGLAYDGTSSPNPSLYVLDKNARIHQHEYVFKPQEKLDELRLLNSIEIPASEDGIKVSAPRGLAVALNEGNRFFYLLEWQGPKKGFISRLWRFDQNQNKAEFIDLSYFQYRIGDREIYGLAVKDNRVYISFNTSAYADLNTIVRRGIFMLKWEFGEGRKPIFIKHMPNSGNGASLRLAHMDLDDTEYVWGTIGKDFIYSAEAFTGRAIFHFPAPSEKDIVAPCTGLTFGQGALWVAYPGKGAFRVARVNVAKNMNAGRSGPRILRHLSMTIKTIPEGEDEHPGKVKHNYSRPYNSEQVANQGIWLKTEKVQDTSEAPNAKVESFTYDPGEDKSSRQFMQRVEYADAPARSYDSRYEIDIWTNAYRKYVYPHRVNLNREALAGTDYLADDATLFNLKDTKTYDSFIQRVKDYIQKEYGVPADMENPYWAARNMVEYIQDHYYYPVRARGVPAAVEYKKKHYDANPGNLKIALSAQKYNKTQIIACSGTSVMIAGAMRYLGFPARWIGTGKEKAVVEWDKNDNGLLDSDEIAGVSSGHRISQVWLGDNYGWICFDGTPSRPPHNDFDPHPPIQPQWRFLDRAGAGVRSDKRIIFNIGSGLFLPLYRDYEFDAQLAINNNCGGDQRYNLQGRFEKIEMWKLPRHGIFVKNMCTIENVNVSGPAGRTRISWQPKGLWNLDPDAKISVYLQQKDEKSGAIKEVKTLVRGLAPDVGQVGVDLSGIKGKDFRIILRKDGDSETGGNSDFFILGK